MAWESRKRIRNLLTELESVQGDEISTFEELQWEIHRMLEADKTGKEYTPRPLSEEVARTLDAALAELRQDPNFAHIFDDDATQRGS